MDVIQLGCNCYFLIQVILFTIKTQSYFSFRHKFNLVSFYQSPWIKSTATSVFSSFILEYRHNLTEMVTRPFYSDDMPWFSPEDIRQLRWKIQPIFGNCIYTPVSGVGKCIHGLNL